MSRPVWAAEGWPAYFELERGGEPFAAFGRRVALLSVEPEWEPDRWCEANPDGRRTLADARVTVEVEGERAALRMRPHEPPRTVGGLRLYVEGVRGLGDGGLIPLDGLRGDVRLSAVPEGAPWGPPGLRHPLPGHRRAASSYANAWGALVPYNALYYHRGEDFGAIPDRLEVVAPWDGAVTRSPLPGGDGASNGLVIEHDCGMAVRFGHMNVGQIAAHLVAGAAVPVGEAVGRSGCTWSGRRSQTHDPHLHVGFHVAGTTVSPYPYLAEAYLREHAAAGEGVLAVAGGHRSALPGETLLLDASRSLAAPGRRVAACRWRLSDGRAVDGPEARVRYDRPGLYSEELSVLADDGSESRDFAQVRAWAPGDDRQRGVTFGWAYSSPERGARPGEPVLFWNRLVHTGAVPVTIDYGDGSPPERVGDEAAHAYAAPGLYTVTLSTGGPGGEPTAVKLCVGVAAPSARPPSPPTNPFS